MGRERGREGINDTGVGSSINESPESPRHHVGRGTPSGLGSPVRGEEGRETDRHTDSNHFGESK